MNVKPPVLADAILEACKRPYGLATDAIEGYTTTQVGRMVQKLQASGLVYRAKVGGKHGRYFDSSERADEYARTAAPRPTCKSKASFASLEAKPTTIRPTLLGNTLRNRFAADDAPPLFSSLKPGQYIAPAPAWVEAVTA